MLIFQLFKEMLILVDFFGVFFLLCKFAPNKAKATLGIRGFKKKMIEHENNSGELDAGINIPLKTVQIVGWWETSTQINLSQRMASKIAR